MNVILKRLDNGRIRILKYADLSTANTVHADFWGSLDSGKLATAKTALDSTLKAGDKWKDSKIKITLRNY